MKFVRISMAALAVVVLLSACATKPPAPEPEPEPVVVAPVEPTGPEISRDELEALHGRVLALRTEAFDLGVKDALPDEYAAADGRYVAGKTALDADDRPVAKSELEAALHLFEALIASGGPKVAEARKAAAAAARERAMAADADTLSPAALGEADAALAKADEALAKGDAKAAIAAYKRAATAYDAVEKRSRASVVKARVDELEFGPMDAGNYELAGQKYDSVDGLVASDPEAAQAAAEEALLRYNLVLSKGWELAAGQRKTGAEKYKVEAEGIKAQVAVKDDYAAAKAVWDKAVAASAAGDNESAAALFEEAEALFQSVYTKASDKRAAALAAMQAADAKSTESAGIAAEGDAILGTAPEGTPDGTPEGTPAEAPATGEGE